MIMVLMCLAGITGAQQTEEELPRIVKNEADPLGAGLARLTFYYRSVDPLHPGDSITMSGAIFLPKDIYEWKKTAAGIVLLNHYTTLRRNEAPSTYETSSFKNTIEKNLYLLEKDYILVCADYYGFGVTETINGEKQPQTYLYADCTARHVLDAYENAKVLLQDLGYATGRLLVNMGYSQGAHTSMAVLKTAEADHHYSRVNFDYTICGGGPYDLQAFYEELMKADDYEYPVAVGMLLTYTHDIEKAQGNADFTSMTYSDVFDAAMVPNVQDFFYSGIVGASFTNGSICNLYGEKSSMDVKKMISSGMKDENSAVFKAYSKVLAKNSLTGGWVPRTEDRIFLFHSTGDDIVYSVCSDNLVSYLESQGIEVGSGKNVTYNKGYYFGHDVAAALFLPMASSILKDLKEEATGIVGVDYDDDHDDDYDYDYDHDYDRGIYNLNGQRLKAPQKGINIIHGRKVLMK